MKKPVVLIVMDGVGENPNEFGNAVKSAYTPTLDSLKATCPYTQIKAHGTAVGLPTDDDMGNSEVGHNALGCGQIYSQGGKTGKRINRKRQTISIRNMERNRRQLREKQFYSSFSRTFI